MYRIYTLDMFYILNFAIVLWIYGTLNKMKWNDINDNYLYLYGPTEIQLAFYRYAVSLSGTQERYNEVAE